MQKKILSSLLAALGLAMSLSAPSMAYPERPESARVIYEMWYFPCRLVSMAVTTAWDVPTAALSDGIKGAIGGTKMVARNLGKEDGVYEMVAGAMTGGPVGLVAGSAYGVLHGAGYGIKHGFIGYPSPHSGSHSMIFQGKGFVVPYDDNY
ncbi:hypothetical protein BH11CYA1_BH11CYA1_45290 [soil metagenome]